MKATKFTVTITMEALSMDTIRALAADAILRIEEENHNGKLVASDGDSVEWETIANDVDF